MSEITLQVKRREAGRSAARAMRRQGIVPGVYYFHGEESIALSAHELALRPLIYTSETHIIRLAFDNGDEKRCILKDIDFDPITDRPVHFDLQGVAAGEKIRTEVPVVLSGQAAGVKDGGILQFVLHRLQIECLPKNLPEHIEVDVANLHIGESIHVGELTLENVTPLHADDQTVVTVVPPRVSADAAEATDELAEESAEPEVIAKGKDDDA